MNVPSPARAPGPAAPVIVYIQRALRWKYGLPWMVLIVFPTLFALRLESVQPEQTWELRGRAAFAVSLLISTMTAALSPVFLAGFSRLTYRELHIRTKPRSVAVRAFAVPLSAVVISTLVLSLSIVCWCLVAPSGSLTIRKTMDVATTTVIWPGDAPGEAVFHIQSPPGSSIQLSPHVGYAGTYSQRESTTADVELLFRGAPAPRNVEFIHGNTLTLDGPFPAETSVKITKTGRNYALRFLPGAVASVSRARTGLETLADRLPMFLLAAAILATAARALSIILQKMVAVAAMLTFIFIAFLAPNPAVRNALQLDALIPFGGVAGGLTPPMNPVAVATAAGMFILLAGATLYLSRKAG